MLQLARLWNRALEPGGVQEVSMFVRLKDRPDVLGVTPQSGAAPCDFLPRSFSKRCIAASVARNKRAAADQAVGQVARAGGRG